MKYAVENIFRFSDPNAWSCSIFEIDGEGNVTLQLLPHPPKRSRLHIVIRNAVYIDSHMSWIGCSVNIANQEDQDNFVSKLEKHLFRQSAEEGTNGKLRLFVIPTSGSNSMFLAEDATIMDIFP